MSDEEKTVAHKVRAVLLWVVTVLAALGMTLAGSGKFMGAEMWAGLFTEWGYPLWFKNLIGTAEIVGGMLLLVPRLATYAGMVVAAIMLGAGCTVVINHSDLGVVTPVLYFVVFSSVAYARRGSRWIPGR